MASADGLALAPGGAGYAFVETAAPAGYVVDPTPHEFTIGYQDQLTPVVTIEAMATNDFTTVRLSKLDEKGEPKAPVLDDIWIDFSPLADADARDIAHILKNLRMVREVVEDRLSVSRG